MTSTIDCHGHHVHSNHVIRLVVTDRHTYLKHLQVEVIDCVADYLATLKEVFDFPTIKQFVGRKDFSFCFDAMNAVTGAYAAPIFVDELGADKSVVK